MAGAGYKLFNTGDVLTAAQVNTYLQEQVVMVFANAAARTTALSGVLAEGMVSYLKDTDALEIYSGSAWVGYGSGDITGITTGATSGLTGGVTSGTADLKFNTTAKGGLLVGTGSGTVTELSVGSNTQVLTADSTTASGLKWATPASGALTLINSTTFSGATSVAVDSVFTSTYSNYFIQTNFTSVGSTNQTLGLRLRSGGSDYTGGDYINQGMRAYPSAVAYTGGILTSFELHTLSSANPAYGHHTVQLLAPNIADFTKINSMGNGYTASPSYTYDTLHMSGLLATTTQYDGFKLFVASGNIAGTVKIYGYQN